WLMLNIIRVACQEVIQATCRLTHVKQVDTVRRICIRRLPTCWVCTSGNVAGLVVGSLLYLRYAVVEHSRGLYRLAKAADRQPTCVLFRIRIPHAVLERFLDAVRHGHRE